MKINVQDFCSSMGAFTSSDIKRGIRKVSREYGYVPNLNVSVSDLTYETGNFTALNESAVKSHIKSQEKIEVN